ncbi:MAG TPA: hypothetical protein VER96_10655 [Polyangiaceae bacterium]|nr:hypothetical protein [Polyangiaceae bacterium]
MGSLIDGALTPGGVVSSAAASELSQRWDEEELGQTAYQRRIGEMLDLPNSKIAVVNLNLTEAIATGLGVLPNVQAFREALSKSVLDCRFQWLDALEDYTLALNFARAQYLTVTRPRRCAPEVWLEARQVRRVLMYDWRALAARGLLDESLLRGVRTGKGYLEMGTDLTVLAHVHRAYAAASGSALSAEAERASVLARSILAAGGRPDRKSEAVAKARNMQNRAFSVFVRAYNEARFSIAYMRRDEGDVDRIIPSLYAARRVRSAGGRRAKGAKEAVKDAPANGDAEPSAVSALPSEEKAPASPRRLERSELVN